MKKLLRSRKFIASALIALYIIVSIVCAVVCYYMFSDLQQPLWEVLYYITQCLSSIFVTGGVIIAVWQYYLSSNNTQKQFKLERVQRAIDLAEYYKNNILPNLVALRYIFKQSGIDDILQCMDVKKFHNFDYTELLSIFNEAQIDMLKTLQESDKFLESIAKANVIYNLNLNLPSSEAIPAQTDSELTMPENNEKESAVTIASNLMMQTLNNMEYFALHFSHQTADESVVYQSLHQTYLQTMPYLYYYIANSNHDPANKFYTNTTWLYNRWVAEKEKQMVNQDKIMNDLPRPGTIMDMPT